MRHEKSILCTSLTVLLQEKYEFVNQHPTSLMQTQTSIIPNSKQQRIYKRRLRIITGQQAAASTCSGVAGSAKAKQSEAVE